VTDKKKRGVGNRRTSRKRVKEHKLFTEVVNGANAALTEGGRKKPGAFKSFPQQVDKVAQGSYCSLQIKRGKRRLPSSERGEETAHFLQRGRKDLKENIFERES